MEGAPGEKLYFMKGEHMLQLGEDFSVSIWVVWFLIGILLALGEFFVPGVILLFFAGGAFIVSLLLLFFDMPLSIQLIIFSASSLVLLFTLRKYCLSLFQGKMSIGDEEEGLSDAVIGKTGQVIKSITPALPGTVKVQGTFWQATAEAEIDEGQAVLVTGQSADKLTIKVKPV